MTALHDERGETLVELLITVMVIAIGVVAVVAALSSSIIASDTHHELSQGEVVVRDYGEAIKRKAIDATAFTSCPTKAQLAPSATDLTSFGLTIPSGWSAAVSSVEYWVPNPLDYPNGTWSAPDSTGTCTTYYNACFNNAGTPACDAGLQRVNYTVTNSRTNYAATSIASRVVIRRNDAP